MAVPIHLFLLPLPRRLRSSRSNQFVVLVLAIPGTSPFSDAIRPPLRFLERSVQKNETHPLFGKEALRCYNLPNMTERDIEAAILQKLGIKLGHYTDEKNVKGTTVFLAEQGARIGIAIRGSNLA